MRAASSEEAKQLGARGIEREQARDWDAALHLYIGSAQLFLALARTANNGSSSYAEEYKRMAARILGRAERLRRGKAHPLGPDVGLHCSEGGRWAVWTDEDCTTTAPCLPQGMELPPALVFQPSTLPVYDSYTQVRGGNICQGHASNCSFVAALEVAAEHDARWNTRYAHSALHPRKDGIPCPSVSGVYSARFFLDGTWRRITLDDRLPHDRQGTLQSATTYPQPVLWPALLEKAFLLAHRSGYDFKGSDGAADLYLLTGWIPQTIPLTRAGFQREKTWDSLYTQWKAGGCMLSAGMGRTVCASDVLPDLVALHCYAMIDLREVDGDRLVTLVNPWKAALDEPRIPAKLECRWVDVCLRMATVGVNWDPAQFPYTDAHHAVWSQDAATDATQSTPSDSYELSLAAVSDEVLVHLECHSMPDCTTPYIALHAFTPSQYHAAPHVHYGGEMGEYVDGRHTLLRLRTFGKASRYVLVASCHTPRTSTPSYSLRVYAKNPFRLRPLPRLLAHRQTIQGVWRARSACGHAGHGSFRHNPQYRIRIQGNVRTPVHVLARLTTEKDVPVQVALVEQAHGRVLSLASGLIASSGAYTPGLALLDASLDAARAYTLVVSTFAPAQADFALVLESTDPVHVETVASEGAGLFHRSAYGASWVVRIERATSARVYISRDSATEMTAQLYGADDMLLTSASADGPCVVLALERLDEGVYAFRTPGAPALLDIYTTHPITLEAA